MRTPSRRLARLAAAAALGAYGVAVVAAPGWVAPTDDGPLAAWLSTHVGIDAPSQVGGAMLVALGLCLAILADAAIDATGAAAVAEGEGP